MTRFALLKSKAFWGSVIYAATRILTAAKEDRPAATLEGVGVVLSASGLRTAIAKNGEGK